MDDKTGEACDTLFYQGIGCSQTHALHYVGGQKITATTGELMWSTGRNKLKPLNVIYHLYIGKEIADVNLHPFDSYFSYFNPVKVIGSAMTLAVNWYTGNQFSPALEPTPDSVMFHAPVISKISIGQETDIHSHREKYQTWLGSDQKSRGLILWGVSRGAATTFCAFAKEKYPEVKLVVLEGAIDSMPEVLSGSVSSMLGDGYTSRIISASINTGLTLFNKLNMMSYRGNGPSPVTSVNDFPEGVPVVFITSQKDHIVPCANTERLAQALVERGKNDVYLIKLKRSNHPTYMYDDEEDRNFYEAAIHAIYKKYHLQHDIELAKKGESHIHTCVLHEVNKHHKIKHPR